jgi:chromosome segregation and condensation protein ScpB
MCGPRSPQPGAPYTYVTTPAFLELNGLPSLRDLPDIDRLEAAGFSVCAARSASVTMPKRK